MNNNPLVAVFMISYNQQDYIVEALSSVLNQKTNFDYHVFLSDDASTDSTQQVVDNYLENHPKKRNVTFIKQKNNLGWMPNFIYTLQRCQDSGAKYIALCEGDDFWSNEDKLQKQIDLLESNDDIVMACHRYKELYNDGSTSDCPFFRKDFFQGKDSFKFTQADFEKFIRIQTMTIVFRSNALDLSLRTKYQFYCDTHIKHHILDHGAAIYTKDNDAVYRVHGNNVFLSQDERKKIKFTYDVYKDLIEKNNSVGYKNLLNISMRQRINSELKNKRLNVFDSYYRQLLLQQLRDTGSVALFAKNFFKGLINTKNT
ncbi:glycosyltransferase [Epilithonimonas arachidiradicis]|uniref:Glycosyl transferase family 2 n=1 Tax=Epilithonimonas arachidiradicis TaxID=1617282 RepID=A0A420DDC4_9FLAO|nr:glycosyltransferase [Epilithonimonas arachidiradicis]RKE89910.1 glycosyl transferase family 2 [Epilithonimonas arachidiradicis]GGG46234.1 hypothetical protein GCM10007332_04700 [Epilithonimonas arachidiradicis]